ncbi:hypothetical protein GCM10009113_15130 [Marinobacter szutsaonensis]
MSDSTKLIPNQLRLLTLIKNSQASYNAERWDVNARTERARRCDKPEYSRLSGFRR